MHSGNDVFRLSWQSILIAIATAAAVTLATADFVLRYYEFYHFGVGARVAIRYAGIPYGFAASAAVLLSCLLLCHLLRRSRGRTAVAMVCVAGALAFGTASYEVWRTTEDRSGEGEGAGDLAPFFASLVGAR